MAIKNSGQKSGTKSKKKKNFLNCNGCMKRFPAANIFQAPVNNRGLRLVCQSCFSQHIGSHTPTPSQASIALKNQYGAFLTSGNAGILSNANAGIINSDTAGFMGLNSGTFIGLNTGTFMGQNSATLISNKAGGIIGQNGLNNNGAGLIGDAGATFGGKIR